MSTGPYHRVIDDVESVLHRASGPVAACRATVETLGRHTGGLVAALLHVRDHLRCVAATGSWQAFSTVQPGEGVVGRVFSSGQTATVTDPVNDPDYIRLGPDVRVEICAPLRDPDGVSIGVLNVEWTSDVDIDLWRKVIEEVALRLSTRVAGLGGAPAETRSEQLLRHALALTSAPDEAQLLDRAIEAACDVSGLATAVLLLPTSAGVRAYRGGTVAGSFGERLSRHLSTVDPSTLANLLQSARQHGASYSLGDPARYNAHGFEELTAIGVRTMIAVPAGPHDIGGVLLVVDEEAKLPDPATVNLLELLAAQGWMAVERLRTLRRLYERASSDPLTGLRHYGPFGERLAAAAPGRTALLAIDVDEFKAINDRYGHQAGDRALVDLARALEGALRESDDLYRIGGDEFVAVIEVRADPEAVTVAERLCAAARATGRTVSVGVAVQADGEAAELTLRRADAALYDAKRTGRDAVRVAPPPPSPLRDLMAQY